jgi:hypothetical protein
MARAYMTCEHYKVFYPEDTVVVGAMEYCEECGGWRTVVSKTHDATLSEENKDIEADVALQEIIKQLETEPIPIKIDPVFRQRLLEDLLELQRRLSPDHDRTGGE